MKNQIVKILEETTGIKSPQVEFSANEEFGDYSSNICLRDSSLDIDKIIEKINYKESLPVTAKAVGGFLNFWLKIDILVDNLIQIDSQKEDYGKFEISKPSKDKVKKLAIVEYSSPNIAKPFGVGHLRSTVIGDAIANLMEFSGYKVMRDNHLGDWGTQFGALLTQISKIPNYKLQMPNWTIDDLVKMYVEFHANAKEDASLMNEARSWFKRLEEGDQEARDLWKLCIDLSWTEFDKIYKLLGIEFDKGFNKAKGLGESFFETRMKAVLSELEDKKLLKVGEDGAKLIFFDEEKYPPLMIIKKDGATLYATRDLATDKYRKEKYDPDIIINEVGSEQSLYFKQLYEAEKLLGWYKDGQRVHVGHGLYMIDGKKMSTRAGKTVKLEEVLIEAIERAKKLGNKSEKLARQVGIGAIKYFDLSHQPMTNINFDWNSMFAMDGNSSPYLQYTIARCNSVIAKSTNLQIYKSTNDELNTEEFSVLRKLSKFQEVIMTAAKTYSPNILCNYLYELASKFNTLYNADKIIGSENEQFRLLLTKSTAQVLKNGLKLLGIEAPEKM